MQSRIENLFETKVVYEYEGERILAGRPDSNRYSDIKAVKRTVRRLFPNISDDADLRFYTADLLSGSAAGRVAIREEDFSDVFACTRCLIVEEYYPDWW